MWELSSALFETPKMHLLLEQGWEPFGATWQGEPNHRTVIYFRRQAPKHTGDNKTDQ